SPAPSRFWAGVSGFMVYHPLYTTNGGKVKGSGSVRQEIVTRGEVWKWLGEQPSYNRDRSTGQMPIMLL
ncbi:MAG: hypothetical protein NZ930_05660, partial [Candidatus Bipolaricaulota bacterium]|nr:hypothetical protein [Candidatus Bipolaricaulota bacterium]